MSIKSDKWIRRMSEEFGMIDPFEPNQIKEANGQRIISYGTSSYGYDIRCANEFKIFTNINSTIVDPKKLRPEKLRYRRRRLLHHPAQFLRTGAHGRILPHPAQRPNRLLGQIHLRPLRHHRQRHPVRAGMGRLCYPRVFQHHPPARQNLRRRRRGTSPLLRERRNLRNFLQRPQRQIHGANRRYPAENLMIG